MQELINISGQQFYYSKVEEGFDSCSQKENCAIIIDENSLETLVKNGDNIIRSNVNQLIIISKSVNAVLSEMEGVSVLLLAAVSLKDAVKLAVLGSALSQNVVVCVQGEDARVVVEVLTEMEVL